MSSMRSNEERVLSGNTKTKTQRSKKQDSPAVHWVFTWNNYPDNYSDVFRSNRSEIKRLTCGHEVGEEGTKHLQGYCEFKKKVRLTYILNLMGDNKFHWEKKAKKATVQQAIRYCWKEDNSPYVQDMCGPPKRFKYEELYPFQKRIVDLCCSKPDDRTVNWFWERTGNVGKSVLTKYLCMNHDAIICSGRGSDMKYLIAKYVEANGCGPKIVILDIPRSNLDYVSYTGLEEIKNGCFASTKYECTMVIIDSPHVVCFANEPPRLEAMSADRWNIECIDESYNDVENEISVEEYEVFDF